MRPATLTVLLAIGSPTLVTAQDATIQQLDSPRARETLFLRVGRADPKVLFQVDDARDRNWHSLPKDTPVLILANENINVWMAAFNPLVQDFDTELKDFDDETYASFKKFAEAVEAYSGSLGLIETESAEAAAKDATKPDATTDGTSATTKQKLVELAQDAGTERESLGALETSDLSVSTLSRAVEDRMRELNLETLLGSEVPEAAVPPEMMDMVLQNKSSQARLMREDIRQGQMQRFEEIRRRALLLAAGLDRAALMKRGFDLAALWDLKPSLGQLESLQKLLDRKTPRTEAWLRLLIGHNQCLTLAEIVKFAAAFAEAEEQVALALGAPGELKAALQLWQVKADGGYEGLFVGPQSVEHEMKSVQKRLQAHAKALTKAVAGLKKDPGWTVGGPCNVVRAEADAMVERFEGRLTKAVNDEKKLAEQLGEVVKTLAEYKDETEWAGNAYLARRDVRPSLEKGREITVKATVRSITVKDGKIQIDETVKDTGIVRFRRYYSIVPEVALGGVLNDLETPKYKVAENDDGAMVVADDGVNAEEMRPAAMLNLLCRCGGLSLVHPGFQIGLTTGEDRPAVLLGGVLRFTKPKHLSISFGGMYTRFEDLRKLAVGSVVENEAALKEDLRFEGRWTFYIGAQVGFKPWKK